MIIELDLVERLSELHDWLVRQFCQIFKEREFHKKQCTILGNTFSPVRFPLGFPEQWAPWFVATKNLTTVCGRKLIQPWEFYAVLKLILYRLFFWSDAASIRVQETPLQIHFIFCNSLFVIIQAMQWLLNAPSIKYEFRI